MTLKDQLGGSWYTMLKPEIQKTYFRKIPSVLRKERRAFNIYPSSENVFRAFRLTPYEQTRVVIVGQDPYYNEGEANGLAFSVDDSIKREPPSLINIFHEIERDLGYTNLDWSTDLTPWAKQGVLLLNRCLTVREGQPRSHRNIGWTKFTQRVLDILNRSPDPMVFMLWGNDAKAVQHTVGLDTNHHLVLTSSHPSPLSSYRGFEGCGHFSKCNNFLQNHNLQPINWRITL